MKNLDIIFIIINLEWSSNYENGIGDLKNQ